MTNWYAVFTRPQCERKVADGLVKRKIESYCPLTWSRPLNNGQKLVQAPLFTGYVFARLSEMQVTDVKSIDGVINIAYWLNVPAKVRDVEIEMLKRFLNVHKETKLEKTKVDTTAMVTLADGTQTQKEGSVVKIDAVGPQLMLPSLGYRLVAKHNSKESILRKQAGSAAEQTLFSRLRGISSNSQ